MNRKTFEMPSFAPPGTSTKRNGKPSGGAYFNEAYDDNEDIECHSDLSDQSTDDDSAYVTIPSEGSDGTYNIKGREPSRKSRKATTKPWDVFREQSADNMSSEDLQLWDTVFKITRVIVCLFMFVIVLGCGVISKSTLLLIVANIIPPGALKNSSLKTAQHHFRYAASNTEVTWIWALVLIMAAPYVFTTFKCTWKLIFKKTRPLAYGPLFIALSVETLHSIGLNFFVFTLLPHLDPISGALLCLNVVFIPAIFGLVYSSNNYSSTFRELEESTMTLVLRRITRAVSLLTSLAALGLWCYYVYAMEQDMTSGSPGLLVIFVVSPLLLSVTWWPNFVPQGDKHSSGIPKLKRGLGKRKTKISVLVGIWKLMLTIAIPSLIYGESCKDGISCIATLYYRETNATLASSTFGFTELVYFGHFGTCNSYLPLLIAAVNIASSIVCYKMAVAACKILAQITSFALPLVLTTPVTLAFVIGVYMRGPITMGTGCSLPFPQWQGGYSFHWAVITAGILGYIGFVLLTNYAWISGNERMERADRLFIAPMYCGILLDQSMILNRRKDQEDTKGVDEKEKDIQLPLPDNLDEWSPGDDWSPLRQDDTPMIYLCATMWHETDNEMTQILKSLFRMDEDQCARRNLQLFFGIRDPDYYEFEAHVFFDDAFEMSSGDVLANGYVKQLIRTIDIAACSVHSFGMKLPPPTKINTPYGGRLIWRLPGGNKLIGHLKDKAKIRHRKRWSQVMYMYYFLGHKLLSMGGNKEKLKTIADNSFLLALDGDVDFQPSALRLLVDRMKRNPNVGAACGRIHPIGSGPMVWYQKFEYAVSHWLQKATEHMIGCVLCSPGCFSLFRGSSVMDDNVMRRYTTPPTEARHYVQYDQGEDRWLCTLLLQQGYRVEYCAASDALTYAPEGFYEFYNQRRRWTPSTMANILDLLMDWRNVTRRNDDISSLYIAYQMLLMVSSILTPGTIFLLVLGAISMAYPELPLYGSLILNLLPVALFVLLCYVAKSEIQLAYAAILSTTYSLIMMLVMVGLMRQAADNGFCSVTTIFLCGVAGIFIISAFLHPQEFWCVIHGFLYFLAIPSMSMLLMLYSLCNLHVVSWGTREVKQPTAAPKAGDNKPQAQKTTMQEWLEKLGFADSVGSSDYMFSFGNLFRCICCPKETKETEDIKLRAILDRLDDIEGKLTDISHSQISGLEMTADTPTSPVQVHFSQSAGLFEGAGERENPLYKEEEGSKPEDSTAWLRDPDVMDGDQDELSPQETVFWKELIDQYLFPLEGDKKQQEATQAELIELRNKVCLFFILINALFITIVFSLEYISQSSGSLSIDLPCSDGQGYGEAIEPISLAFTAVFGILLVIQFICMIFHRLGTFLHILSITEIKVKRPKQMKPQKEKISVEKGLQLVREMQCAKDDDSKSLMSVDIESKAEGEAAVSESQGNVKSQELWNKLARRRKETQHGTLSHNFLKNFKKLQKYMQEEDTGHNLSVIDEDVGQNGIEEHRLQTVRKKFNRFDRKSVFTIVQMSKDDRLKKSILQRGELITNKWQRLARRAHLRERVAKSEELRNSPDTKQDRKITMADIAALALSEKKRAESKDIDVDEKF